MRQIPVQTLPPEYALFKRLDIRERKSAILINFFSVILFVAAWFLFTWLVNLIRPDAGIDLFFFQTYGIGKALLYIGEVLLVILVMLLVHEGLHGVFFWFFTKTRPHFAFKGYYAYAAAPDWYMPKRAYLLTSLAPLIGITLICLALIPFVSEHWITLLLWMLLLNTSGAIGDLWVAFELLRSPELTYGRDFGDLVD